MEAIDYVIIVFYSLLSMLSFCYLSINERTMRFNPQSIYDIVTNIMVSIIPIINVVYAAAYMASLHVYLLDESKSSFGKIFTKKRFFVND